MRESIPSPLGPIPVWVWGDGSESIILVHGWSGRGLQLGAFVRPLVAEGFRVVTFDAPGHGEAPGRTSSMPAIAASLGAVGRQFGPVSMVIAHSLGCAATIYALTQRELSADRLVAISPAARLSSIREQFAQMTGFSSEVIDRMKKTIEDRFGFEWEESEPFRVASAMPMPMMVIHDADDRFTSFGEGSALAEAWPAGRMKSTTGLGHHRILRDRDVVNTAVSYVSEETDTTFLGRRAS